MKEHMLDIVGVCGLVEIIGAVSWPAAFAISVISVSVACAVAVLATLTAEKAEKMESE